MEANVLTDRELLPERKSKTTFGTGSSLVNNGFYGMRRDSKTCRIEICFQAHAETGYVVENRCYPPPQGTETSAHSRKLATWRRSNGFDRCEARDGQWIRSALPPSPEETTASMWAEVNAIKKVREIEVDGQ